MVSEDNTRANSILQTSKIKRGVRSKLEGKPGNEANKQDKEGS